MLVNIINLNMKTNRILVIAYHTTRFIFLAFLLIIVIEFIGVLIGYFSWASLGKDFIYFLAFALVNFILFNIVEKDLNL